MPTPLSPPINTPKAAKLDFAEAASKVIPGDSRDMSIHIKTGITVTVYVTGQTNDEINADTAEWVAVTALTAKAGPYVGAIPTPCTGVKITSTGAGSVYIQRG